MINQLLDFVAPHYCSGCGKAEALLCGNCKYNIISEPFSTCISCARSLSGPSGICNTCKVPYERAWCVGERKEALQRLIGSYKFTNARAAYRTLGGLLDEHLPVLPENTIVVPVPTVSSHIRQRGYDHMLLVTKQLAKRRKLQHSTVLERATSTKQRDAGYRLRIKQAKEAFVCPKTLDNEAIYLLIDDVVTTGATLKYGAKVLRDAGASKVWVAAISRQPLD